MQKYHLIALLIFSTFICQGQNTVGVTDYQQGALDGYTFFSPFSGTKSYMVDNCGNLVNQWDRGTQPGLSAYFLDNGLVMRTYKIDPEGPFTSASNAGGIELVDWDNNTVWSYEINTDDHLSHHDAVMMPNGHILILTWKLVYKEAIIELGRDPNEIAPQNFMWSERILELEPILGSSDANILWEWNIYNHYIQDFDETKVGFGVISEHPELFNINLPELDSDNSNSTRDWNHFNAIDYNEELDQILLSVRNSDEIWILDHSTTTEEASTHEGGTYGKGGDILYRWGNSAAYNIGVESDQTLFGQHGVNWIKDGLDDAGKIMIFNNGNHRPGPDYSQIDILDAPQSAPGFYITEVNNPWGPEKAQTIYNENDDSNFYSPYLSNAQRLPNGNTLINEGSPGRIFEIDQSGEIVWEYEIPLYGDFPATQGDNVNNNASFRAYKFPLEFIGFTGIEIEIGEPIENNPSECQILVNTMSFPISDFQMSYSNVNQTINWENPDLNVCEISIYKLSGQQMYETKHITSTQIQLPVAPLGSFICTATLCTGQIVSEVFQGKF